MVFRFKPYVLAAVVLCSGYVGYWTWRYFFSETLPVITVAGLESGAYYEGDVPCCVTGSDTYKVAELSIWLDGKPVVEHYRINSRRFEHPFVIPTRSLPNGKHLLKLMATNGTYHQQQVHHEVPFFVDNTALQGAFVHQDLAYKVLQGRTLHVQFQTNKPIKQAKVQALSHEFSCFPESKSSLIYECFIPIPCEETPNEYLLQAVLEDHVGNSLSLDNKFQVIAFPFKKQAINVDAEKVEQEKEISLSNALLEESLQCLLAESPREKLWRGSFCTPIDVTGISTDFGTIRTSQEKGRYVHTGLDVLAPPKSVVWAPQDGIVRIKERYSYSGNTIVLDHGYGIFSLFFHLDSFSEIGVGQKLKKGDPIGKLGKTGYASGYHLHWEMRIHNTPIDPMQWTKQGF